MSSVTFIFWTFFGGILVRNLSSSSSKFCSIIGPFGNEYRPKISLILLVMYDADEVFSNTQDNIINTKTFMVGKSLRY
eukprot:10350.XXX_232812_233045_1 [CDS] Oithona nana genome sequencing.